MGGRGSASGLNSGSSVLDKKAPTRTIDTVYREAKGWSKSYYKDEVLEAVAGDNGALSFEYARPVSRDKTAKTNRTQYVSFELKSGAVNGETFGINWDKVKSVSGQTYNMRDELKKRGYKWDGKNKKWTL